MEWSAHGEVHLAVCSFTGHGRVLDVGMLKEYLQISRGVDIETHIYQSRRTMAVSAIPVRRGLYREVSCDLHCTPKTQLRPTYVGM
jgi:hypothetical protein